MKVKQFFYLILMIALATPMLVDAQIYKWKDKNGVTRYSDTPPTGGVKADKVGRSNAAVPKAKAPVDEASKARAEQAEDEAARLRARNAEIEKRNAEEKAAQAKIKAENCRAAKRDYATFAQGGRIYQMNDKGEREYYDDAGLAQRKAQAEAQIRQYCH